MWWFWLCVEMVFECLVVVVEIFDLCELVVLELILWCV